jgi:CRP-like cAMP-binding protein
MQSADGSEVEVGKMERGQFFGERALLTNEPRAATVRAVGPVKVAMMAKDAFERLLGDVKDVLHRHMKSYPSAREILAQLGGGTTGRSMDDVRQKDEVGPLCTASSPASDGSAARGRASHDRTRARASL